jgi:hypothetical protein
MGPSLLKLLVMLVVLVAQPATNKRQPQAKERLSQLAVSIAYKRTILHSHYLCRQLQIYRRCSKTTLAKHIVSQLLSTGRESVVLAILPLYSK